MGYGTFALNKLLDYFQNISTKSDNLINESNLFSKCSDLNISNNTETLKSQKSIGALFMKLEECSMIQLNYIGVNYGITERLFK